MSDWIICLTGHILCMISFLQLILEGMELEEYARLLQQIDTEIVLGGQQVLLAKVTRRLG